MSLSMDLDDGDEDISYGIVSAEAADFPIVEGILRLHVDEYREVIVEHLRERRPLQALTVALDRGPFGGRASAAINLASSLAFRNGFNTAGDRLSRLKRNFVRVLTERERTFVEVAEKLGTDGSRAHQIHRFTMPGFLSTFPLTHLVRPEGQVLSFACGTGQEPFLISRLWPNTKVVCADYSFCSLYMAKRYFAPEASYVCLDADYLLPFESGQFSTIFSSDTLPVLDSKLSLVQEFTRIGDDRAVMLLPHIHNRMVWPFAKSLTPSSYRQLFRHLQTRILPDSDLVTGYFFNDVIDLTRNCSDDELAASGQHLSIVASKDPTIFVKRENVWKERFRSMGRPCINPAYRISGQPGDWQLKRHVNDYYTNAVRDGDRVCLPDTLRITTRSLDSQALMELQRSDPDEFSRLAKSLVILDLPEQFSRQNHQVQFSKGLITVRQPAG